MCVGGTSTHTHSRRSATDLTSPNHRPPPLPPLFQLALLEAEREDLRGRLAGLAEQQPSYSPREPAQPSPREPGLPSPLEPAQPSPGNETELLLQRLSQLQQELEMTKWVGGEGFRVGGA